MPVALLIARPLAHAAQDTPMEPGLWDTHSNGCAKARAPDVRLRTHAPASPVSAHSRVHALMIAFVGRPPLAVALHCTHKHAQYRAAPTLLVLPVTANMRTVRSGLGTHSAVNVPERAGQCPSPLTARPFATAYANGYAEAHTPRHRLRAPAAPSLEHAAQSHLHTPPTACRSAAHFTMRAFCWRTHARTTLPTTGLPVPARVISQTRVRVCVASGLVESCSLERIA
jgi:hypothetical protein